MNKKTKHRALKAEYNSVSIKSSKLNIGYFILASLNMSCLFHQSIYISTANQLEVGGISLCARGNGNGNPKSNSLQLIHMYDHSVQSETRTVCIMNRYRCFPQCGRCCCLPDNVYSYWIYLLMITVL